ncbi:MAG TPA: glycoside hydrolase family 16 protein [Candidatus Bathyarchaeia archaeon]|nr:glycoside hydrolase family 16 protein [Candidatus Bathyarchaeia archaeon]
MVSLVSLVFLNFPWADMNANNSESADAQAQTSFATTASWKQDFSKSPNGPLDTKIWNFDQGNNNGWGNNELESYTSDPANASIQNGALVINALKNNGSYTSARITTKNKFDFIYGKINVVAQLPTGQGVWPAIWLLPTDTKYTSNTNPNTDWLSNGELDIAEGSSQGDNSFSASAHSINHYGGHNERTGTVTVNSPATTLHTYSLEWTPQSLDFLVDGKVFEHVANSGAGFQDWPYDQRYHLILNLALGGDNGSNLSDGALPAQMKVRLISYYPYVGK